MLKKRVGAVLATLAMVVSGLGFVAQSAPAANAATVIQGWCNTTVWSYVGANSSLIVPAMSTNGTRACKMSQGSKSSAVQAMQEALTTCYEINLGQIDANWGAQTTAALRTFQQSRGLVVDAVYGPATHNALLWIDRTPSLNKPCIGDTKI